MIIRREKWKQIKILPAVFLVGFTKICIFALIRAAQFWNKSTLSSLK